MKRNYMFGLCGAAAIAIITAAPFRPGFAQLVRTPEPLAPSAESKNEPVATAPAPGMSPSAAPTAGGGVALFSSGPVLTAPDPNNPFAHDLQGARTLSAHFPQGNQPPLQHLAAAVRGAKDDAARAAATEQMQKTLNDTFDADMKRREQEFTKLEERLKALRQQMIRRQEKKAEIIELQSRVLLNEADGLGFYSNEEVIYGRPATSIDGFGGIPISGDGFADPTAVAPAPAGGMAPSADPVAH